MDSRWFLSLNWKYVTVNNKDSHKNGLKDSTNHKNSSTREIQKHKALRLVKAVKQREYQVLVGGGV